ncbi:hypothetical protein GJW-30_1_03490 [Variibacter gotjawalensis]|uniref:Bacterial bifunctional deaminase-reductase C-terminal domain-containing protein n=1 Tax=Variibacter gotjawalensis TaxID=1333996 RepID=A0A0S3PYB0_9BRAD|nr:dihydrofolate reductase family protein [Variibacter gotjawalensis]NIK46777.1 dihydrofolate reductase [Variibacter gotjawalensis]RZS48681.1 dihydrofolate reductase [Variibacter gotjawalensis]BAT60940.1 hypothetical protein GJW-30_1_03490 [Variibacter gotjawalensis]
MRKVIVGAFVSLDGVMQAPGGPEEDPTGGFKFGGWTVPYWDDEIGGSMSELLGNPFDLLLGRKTYEIFAAHWPFMTEETIAPAFNKCTKYVASRKGVDLTWENSVALKDAAKDVAKLKAEDGPVLLVQGSSDLIQTLLAADLVDELRLLTYPVTLGGGKKLFSDGARPHAFKLTKAHDTPVGVVVMQYTRGGEARGGNIEDVAGGTFALDEPTELELKRRERMKREG